MKAQYVLILLYLYLALIHSQDCFLPRNLTNCEECVSKGLDLSTGCTTCVSPPSIECEEGEQNCAVGDFVFSALFHSYQNPTHMCAECSGSGPVTCESVRRGMNCGLRFIYCLQPYGSQSFDPPLEIQARFGTDNETFVGDFFIHGNTGSLTPNQWNRSNPFTRDFDLWPGRTQLAIVVYSTVSGGAPEPRVVDRVLIDLELNISSSFTERRTYSGVNNFSHFDMSFNIDGECGDNYYGPLCNIFCRPEEGVFTCDSEGNRVCVNRVLDPAMNCTQCVNRVLDPAMNCTQCLDTDQDPEDNCGVTTMQTDATTTEATSTSTMPSSSASTIDDGSATLIGAVVGGVVGGVLLVIVSVLLVVILCMCVVGRKEKTNKEVPSQLAEGHYEMSPDRTSIAEKLPEPRQFVNPVYGEGEPQTTAKASSTTAAAATGEGPESNVYSAVVNKTTKEPDRNFDNPIYGDDLESNVYSQTSHATAPPTLQQTDVSLGPNSQYGVLDPSTSDPHYEMPHDQTGGSKGNNGVTHHHYDDAIVPPSANSVPPAAIYSELEEHNYSVLDNNH